MHDEDTGEEIGCPYCDSTDNCRHLLAVIDQSFGGCGGGYLAGAVGRKPRRRIGRRHRYDKFQDVVAKHFLPAAVGARRNSRPFQVKVPRTDKKYYQKSSLRNHLEALWKEARAQYDRENPDYVHIDGDLLSRLVIELLIESGGEEYCGSIDDGGAPGYSSSIALLYANEPAKVFKAAVEFLEAQFLPEGE